MCPFVVYELISLCAKFELQYLTNMKKRVFIVSLVFLVCLQFGASVNYQKTYLSTDEVWIRANRLCIMTGHLGPAPVFPTTGAEIMNAL